MWTDNLDKRNAGLVQHHLERLLEIDEDCNYLGGAEFHDLRKLLMVIRDYRKYYLIKQ